jgi:threonine/homoserine/homoserine lactone efflux protein
LAEGRLIGFLSGLGAATADMSYGAVAGFGLTVVRDALVRQQFWLHTLGGLFLVYLGARTFLARPAESAAGGSVLVSRWAAYLSTLGLTLTNPATILSFGLVFAGLRIVDTNGSYSTAALLVAGVFLGSAAWWLTLSGVVGLFRERFSQRWMMWVNRLAGAIILAFGVAALLTG